MNKYAVILNLFFIFNFSLFSQELDVDELLEKIERLEKNVSDLQKGKFDELDKSLSSGYISRNEQRLDNFETKTRANFGLIEEIDNKIKQLEEKFSILNKEFQSRMLNIEKQLKNIKKTIIESDLFKNKIEVKVNESKLPLEQVENINETEIKKNMKML